MDRSPNPNTLFHLVPENDLARNALEHPDNARFVSLSAKGDLGLEIGFHVPSTPSGYVVTRLGRNADLILKHRTASAIHFAFEINRETNLIRLSSRSKKAASVIVRLDDGNEVVTTGDSIILYGENCYIRAAFHTFYLVWRQIKTRDNSDALRDLAVKCYQESQAQLATLKSRDHPTELGDESELHSWHNTRLWSANRPLFEDSTALCVLIGQGGFGKVFKTNDLRTGNVLAVKVVDLLSHGEEWREKLRAALHGEIKTLKSVSHTHIVQYLGTQNWHTDSPETFMPLYRGSLKSLAAIKGINQDSMCNQVAEQMLQAFDYLDASHLCHCDVKPDNILYMTVGPGKYHFYLTDFGFVKNQKLAISWCGTPIYQAPEVNHPEWEQSPKMDIWSLLASLLDVHRSFNFPPPGVPDYPSIVKAIVEIAKSLPRTLHLMGRENPKYRASAAQLLLLQFNGKGLTTRREAIQEIIDDTEEEPQRAKLLEARPIKVLTRPQSPSPRQLRLPRPGMTRAGHDGPSPQLQTFPEFDSVGPFSKLLKRPRLDAEEVELPGPQREKRHNKGH